MFIMNCYYLKKINSFILIKSVIQFVIICFYVNM